MIYPVILSGGVGSRLWPTSRALHPKQFLPLCSDNSMLAETALRFAGKEFSAPIVVCNREHRFMVAQALQDVSLTAHSILLEPCARNTAPAIMIAALHISKIDPEAIMMILPSDHVIQDPKAFQQAALKALPVARDGGVVTFGINPNSPETGYGYIKRANSHEGTPSLYHVAEFVEKPDLPTAKEYLESGDYFWNSGMFLIKAKAVIDELNKYEPKLGVQAISAYDTAVMDMDFIRIDEKCFEKCPSISIDYALMERTKHAVVMPVDVGWNDLGSWTSMWEISDKDSDGNVVKGDVVMEGVKNSLVHSNYGTLSAVIGVEDLIIVNDDDVCLVAAKDSAQDVKLIIDRLNAKNRQEVNVHSTVYRPWGSYRTLEANDGYLVKSIMIHPQSKLSLQYHHHRAEHWVVVQGKAKVTRGEEDFIMEANQSCYIPVEMVHRLENVGTDALLMVEVQTGTYLAEDDIVRLEDLYGREPDTSKEKNNVN